jgi:GH24 family phage-related lysozyme (muramidase)
MSKHQPQPKVASAAPPNAQMAMSSTARASMRATEKAVYRYYNDMGKNKGNCTWGVGILAHKGVCSEEELARNVSAQSVDSVFNQKVAEAEGIVRRGILVPLNQAQFDALCSLAFNAGRRNTTDTFGFVNRGDFSGAATNISKMTKVSIKKDGKKIHVIAPGLIKRRAEESAPFRHHSTQSTDTH